MDKWGRANEDKLNGLGFILAETIMVKVKANYKSPDEVDSIVCRCEEIGREEIVAAIRSGARSIGAIARRTSACMGLCQGKTCQKLITQILKKEGVPMENIRPRTVRPPVRPVPVHSLGSEVKQE